MNAEKTFDIIVIGGGAAGFFAAINAASAGRGLRIAILEKSRKLLSKVRISGGGRCNVTYNCFDNEILSKNYPRGARELRQLFSRFSVKDTIAWFESHGVKLKTEADGRIFPESDSSETIIDCFLSEARRNGIQIHQGCEVTSMSCPRGVWLVKTSEGEFNARAVICSAGGHPKAGTYDFIARTGHTIVPPIPSLFTVNLPGDPITKLQGISVAHAEIALKGSRYAQEGAILITHWGLSGPAVLRLSAFAAQEFHERGYDAAITVNWIYPSTAHDVTETLASLRVSKPSVALRGHPQWGLPRRLWEYFCERSGISEKMRVAETGKSAIRELAGWLAHSSFHMKGKTTFKEEFVTCGGVKLSEVDFRTMESKVAANLYFCGEVLNIDGVTGGFNFQAAWSAAYVAGNSAAERLTRV